jgi:hypothetical protein
MFGVDIRSDEAHIFSPVAEQPSDIKPRFRARQ